MLMAHYGMSLSSTSLNMNEINALPLLPCGCPTLVMTVVFLLVRNSYQNDMSSNLWFLVSRPRQDLKCFAQFLGGFEH